MEHRDLMHNLELTRERVRYRPCRPSMGSSEAWLDNCTQLPRNHFLDDVGPAGLQIRTAIPFITSRQIGDIVIT